MRAEYYDCIHLVTENRNDKHSISKAEKLNTPSLYALCWGSFSNGLLRETSDIGCSMCPSLNPLSPAPGVLHLTWLLLLTGLKWF